jgi:phosphinothricin acetyltransferase
LHPPGAADRPDRARLTAAGAALASGLARAVRASARDQTGGTPDRASTPDRAGTRNRAGTPDRASTPDGAVARQAVVVTPLSAADWPDVRRIYADGISSGLATFETEVPPAADLDARWLPGHRWVAVPAVPAVPARPAGDAGAIAGWAALSPTSGRACYAGVAETSVYVDGRYRGRGVGTALLARLVAAADAAGLWTLQASIFPANRASVALHHAHGFRTVGVRERIARRDGEWRDTVLLERRAPHGPTAG